ncbi:MAG: hypothetical protein EBZ58_06905, partial [Bacteroidetes bacterium]|nr:hypothetical protein [Bacteroidota bacterium]
QVGVFEVLDEWWKRERLYSLFELSSGGFDVIKATKFDDDKFEIETIKADNIGFPNANIYIRPSNDYYKSCFDLYTDKDISGAYSNGKYLEIKNLTELSNRYYKILNSEPETETTTGHKSSSWYSSENPPPSLISDNGIKVYYKLKGNYYKVVEKDWIFFKDIFIYLIIELVIVSIIVVIISRSKL